MKEGKTPIHEKYTLSIEQAADYFGIGQRKMRQIANEHMNDNSANFVLQNGAKIQIKRKLFEQFIDKTSCI